VRLEDLAALEDLRGLDRPPAPLDDAMRAALRAFAARDDVRLRQALKDALRALGGDGVAR
jgi:hypothetical protein